MRQYAAERIAGILKSSTGSMEGEFIPTGIFPRTGKSVSYTVNSAGRFEEVFDVGDRADDGYSLKISL